jgi:hypothetical protein
MFDQFGDEKIVSVHSHFARESFYSNRISPICLFEESRQRSPKLILERRNIKH